MSETIWIMVKHGKHLTDVNKWAFIKRSQRKSYQKHIATFVAYNYVVFRGYCVYIMKVDNDYT